MIVYEVTLEVDLAIAADYYRWLLMHVGEMLALPGFFGADIYECSDPPPPSGRIAWCVHYRLQDAQALDDYLRVHATRMRADGMTRFPGRFSASRRVLTTASAPAA